MAYLSPRDPDFWDHQPPELKAVQAATEAEGLRILHILLGAIDDECTPAAGVLEMPPGYVLARHSHPAWRFEVVIQGSIEADGRTLGVGDIMVSPPNEMYGPHTAGPEGCTTIEFHSSVRSVGNVTFDGNEAPTDFSEPGAKPPPR